MRMINSGIRNDDRILEQYHNAQVKSYNDSIMLAGKDAGKFGSDGSQIPLPKYKTKMCGMLCQRTIRPQDEIYEAHLKNQGKPLPEKYTKHKVADEEIKSVKMLEKAFASEISEVSPQKELLLSQKKV